MFLLDPHFLKHFQQLDDQRSFPRGSMARQLLQYLLCYQEALSFTAYHPGHVARVHLVALPLVNHLNRKVHSDLVHHLAPQHFSG